MKKLLLTVGSIDSRTVFFSILAFVFFYLLLRNTGLYPVVLSDEWTYSSFSRLVPLSEVPIPSYLYFSAFRATNFCGDGFLSCARAINSFFFVATAPFIYLVARRFMSRNLSGFVAILSICSPLNAYTAYFMPEATYYLSFWVLTWSAFRFFEAPTSVRCAVLGTTMALISMVKIHALFLLPGFSLFILYTAYATRAADSNSRWWHTGLRLIVIALTTAAVVRLGVGYLYAGRNGLVLFGDLYNGQAEHTAATRTSIWQLIPAALLNARGHAMALALLFGVPLAAALAYPLPRAESKQNVHALLVYSLLMLCSLLAVTVMFTASVIGNGPYETNARLHMRYYDFMFPLFLIFAGSQLSDRIPELPIVKKFAIGIPLAAIIICGNYLLLNQFKPSFVDCPELSGFTSDPNFFKLLTALAVFSIFAWIANNKLGAKIFIFGFMPLYTVMAGAMITSTIRQPMQADDYDQAGMFVRQYLSKEQSDGVVVVGADVQGLYKAKFHIDNPKVDLLPTPEGGEVDLSNLPRSKHWLLVIGNHPMPKNVDSRLVKGKFALLRIVPVKQDIDFSKPLSSGDVDSTAGLAASESWGSWSTTKHVGLMFAAALPKKLTVHLTAYAFGPNIGRDFVLTIGQNRQLFLLAATPKEVILNLETDGTQHVIGIDVPQPTSPKQLGLSDDARLLGLALIHMEVGSNNENCHVHLHDVTGGSRASPCLSSQIPPLH